MSELIVIGISDQNTAKPPDILVSYALGSCVGICLYDNLHRIAGLSHILLPNSKICNGNVDVYKFADTAIKSLVSNMEKLGCSRFRLTAKISGGANMFLSTGKSIGEKNVKAVIAELDNLKIKIIAQDTGGNYGRTLEFNPENGQLLIKSLLMGNKVL
jgi:chemotaxis protein CheD